MQINPWHFLIVGYLLTISVETPILMVGLSSRHKLKNRLFAGLWVNACSYPIVVLVLHPLLIRQLECSRAVYLIVAETFAPVSECVLFWLAFGSAQEFGKRSMWRDFAAIVVANLVSFGVGELISYLGWWEPIFRSVYRLLSISN
jgi:hypothetical protein